MRSANPGRSKAWKSSIVNGSMAMWGQTLTLTVA
jgi:hypothetical protein